MEINIPAVEHVAYAFKCSSENCAARVIGTLPAVKLHGWMNISTYDKANQWLWPVHGLGLVKADPA